MLRDVRDMLRRTHNIQIENPSTTGKICSSKDKSVNSVEEDSELLKNLKKKKFTY